MELFFTWSSSVRLCYLRYLDDYWVKMIVNIEKGKVNCWIVNIQTETTYIEVCMKVTQIEWKLVALYGFKNWTINVAKCLTGKGPEVLVIFDLVSKKVPIKMISNMATCSSLSPMSRVMGMITWAKFFTSSRTAISP